MLKSKSKIFKRFVEDVDSVLSMVTTQSNVEKGQYTADMVPLTNKIKELTRQLIITN